jgi:hypothetical protein
MKYKILISTSPGWPDKPIEADLTSQINITSFSKALLSSEKISYVPNLIFNINQVTNLPDFISSGIFWLFSERFLNIISSFSTSFESFPVTIMGKQSLFHNYHLFHLLEVRKIIDLEKSKIQSRTHVEYIELNELNEFDQPPMVRDAFLLSLVFVRSDVIQAIQSKNILGCGWMEPGDYTFVLKKKRW